MLGTPEYSTWFPLKLENLEKWGRAFFLVREFWTDGENHTRNWNGQGISDKLSILFLVIIKWTICYFLKWINLSVKLYWYKRINSYILEIEFPVASFWIIPFPKESLCGLPAFVLHELRIQSRICSFMLESAITIKYLFLFHRIQLPITMQKINICHLTIWKDYLNVFVILFSYIPSQASFSTKLIAPSSSVNWSTCMMFIQSGSSAIDFNSFCKRKRSLLFR